MKFQYYEIRCCVDTGNETRSFLGKPVSNSYDDHVFTPEGALAEAKDFAGSGEYRLTPFWTLYGRDEKNHAVAIGDFKTFEAAYEVQCAILAPMRQAANLIESETGSGCLESLLVNEAHSLLDDICNQSSHEERL